MILPPEHSQRPVISFFTKPEKQDSQESVVHPGEILSHKPVYSSLNSPAGHWQELSTTIASGSLHLKQKPVLKIKLGTQLKHYSVSSSHKKHPKGQSSSTLKLFNLVDEFLKILFPFCVEME